MEKVVQTSPYWNKDVFLFSFLMPITVAMQLGTGGNATLTYNRSRYDIGAATAGYYRPQNDTLQAEVTPSIASDLSRIIDVLKPSVSSLAKHIGVSRTAIYDWLGGKQISPPNAAKVQNFAKAADVIAAANVQMSPIVRNRKISDAGTLFDTVAAGVDGEKAAFSLVEMLRSEAERRNQLTSRFAGRKTISESMDDSPVVFNE